MNGNKAETEHNIIQIFIEKYEKDFETKLEKEKKKEIIDLLTNSNNLLSGHKFEGYQETNLELIKIYLSETINNDSKDLQFKINKTNLTASLFKVN